MRLLVSDLLDREDGVTYRWNVAVVKSIQFYLLVYCTQNKADLFARRVVVQKGLRIRGSIGNATSQSE